MALPALRALKFYFPEATIYLVTKNTLSGIFKNIQEIQEIITIPDKISFQNIFTTARLLRKTRIKQGILFTNSFASALLFRLAGIKKLLGYAKDYRSFLLSTALPFPENDRHHIHFYLDLVLGFKKKQRSHSEPEEPATLTNTQFSNALVITPAEREQVLSRLTELGIGEGMVWVGIAPAAAYGSGKQWLPDRFAQLVQRISNELPHVQLLLFGTQKEFPQIASIAGNGKFPAVFNLAGLLSLRETIVAMSFCHGFIANDSGLMHVASSLNIPLLALFGPTRPEKSGPLHAASVVIHYPTDCGPCLSRQCPFPDHPCMSAITVEDVFAKLVGVLPVLEKHE